MKRLKYKWPQIFLWISLLLSIVSIIRIIVIGFPETINSDSATALILADEQIKSRSLFPDGWVYADSIWTISLNIFVFPFMLFIDNWLVCRILAVIFQLVLIVVALIWLESFISTKYKGILAIIFLLPMSTTILENFYFQATYGTQVLWYVLVFACAYKFLKCEKRYVQYISLGIILGLVTLLSAYGVRHLLTLVFPLICAIVLNLYWSRDEGKQGVKKRCILFGIIIIAAFLGFSVYIYLENVLCVAHVASEPMISQGYELLGRFGAAVGNLFSAFGAVDYGTLVSANGIFKGIRAVYCIFSIVYVPFVLWKRRQELTKYQMIYFAYAMVSFAAVMYINIFTNIGHARYFLSIYFNCCVLNVIWLGMQKISKLLQYVFWGALFVSAIYLHRHYNIYDYKENVEFVGYYPTLKNKEEVLTFLDENDMYMGYATYWNANVLTALSDGRIRMMAVQDVAVPDMELYYWLCNTNWYDAYESDVPSFLLVTQEEFLYLNEKYVNCADKIEYCGEYVILIYSYNILKS